MKLYFNPQSRAVISKWMLDECEVGDGPYLFGDWFTAADIMIGSMFIWKRLLGMPADRPKLEAYVDRLLARPKAMKIGS